MAAFLDVDVASADDGRPIGFKGLLSGHLAKAHMLPACLKLSGASVQSRRHLFPRRTQDELTRLSVVVEVAPKGANDGENVAA